MQFNDSPSQLHPPNNPILESYLNFKKETPLVTRYVLTSQLICFLISYIFDPTDAAANIPYFTIRQFEVYRIILSPFLCNRFFSLVFAYFNFTENGRRLELSMGSTAFFCLIFTIGILTNLIYIAVAFLLNAITGSESLLFLPASGIWIILFGVISIECSQAPPQSIRRLFFMPVSATYYPLALLGLFSLMGTFFDLSYLISVAVGYAYGYVFMRLCLIISNLNGVC
jgi:membrane associated rhomboid family serine protease